MLFGEFRSTAHIGAIISVTHSAIFLSSTFFKEVGRRQEYILWYTGRRNENIFGGYNYKPDGVQTSHYNLDNLVAEWQKKYSEHRFSNIFLRYVSFLENIFHSALQGDI